MTSGTYKQYLDEAILMQETSASVKIFADRKPFLAGPDPLITETVLDSLELYNQRKYQELVSKLQEFLADTRGISPRIITYAVILLSRAQSQLSRSTEAIVMLEDPVLKSYFVDPPQIASRYWQIGNHLRILRKFNEAMNVLQNAFEMASAIAGTKFSSKIKVDLGSVFLAQGNVVRAINLYEQALGDFADDSRYEDVSVRTRVNLASAFQIAGRNEEALVEYELLLALPAVQADPSLLLAIHLNHGISLKRLGKLDDAEREYLTVRLLAQKQGEHHMEVRALNCLAHLHIEKSDFDSARSYATASKNIAKSHDLQSIIVETISTLAGIDKRQGRNSDAIDQMQEAFSLFLSAGDHHNAINVSIDLVSWLKDDGRFQEALDVQDAIFSVQKTIYDGEIERSLEVASARSRFEHDRESIRLREEGRNKILHSVLPAHIAERLISGEKQIVDTLPAVTILFADVVGFTSLASTMEPDELLDLLSNLFSGMDDAAASFGCERIKTIGDCYMAICGASVPVVDHVERIARMALSLVSGEVSLPIPTNRLRIGIHTGRVIAGVMDGQRLSYDVWGDTVNVAARMEELSRPGGIHCTQDVALQLDQLHGFSLIKREPLDIHGKGLMQTFWVEPTV